MILRQKWSKTDKICAPFFVSALQKNEAESELDVTNCYKSVTKLERRFKKVKQKKKSEAGKILINQGLEASLLQKQKFFPTNAER